MTPRSPYKLTVIESCSAFDYQYTLSRTDFHQCEKNDRRYLSVVASSLYGGESDWKQTLMHAVPAHANLEIYTLCIPFVTASP